MTEITFLDEEVAPNVLPPICMVCGSDQATLQPTTFQWVPPITLITLPLGILPFFIIRTILLQTMTAHLPICQNHKYYWFKRKMVLPLGLTTSVLSFGVLYAIFSTMKANGNETPPMGWICTIPFAIAFITITIWIRQLLFQTRVLSIRKGTITFQDADEKFVAAVMAGRIAYQKQLDHWASRRNMD